MYDFVFCLFICHVICSYPLPPVQCRGCNVGEQHSATLFFRSVDGLTSKSYGRIAVSEKPSWHSSFVCYTYLFLLQWPELDAPQMKSPLLTLTVDRLMINKISQISMSEKLIYRCLVRDTGHSDNIIFTYKSTDIFRADVSNTQQEIPSVWIATAGSVPVCSALHK